jgi:hypothetical protein
VRCYEGRAVGLRYAVTIITRAALGALALHSRSVQKPARGLVVAISVGAFEAPGHGLSDRPTTSTPSIEAKLA